MSNNIGAQVIQGEVIKKLSLAQSALRTMESGGDAHTALSSSLSSARELLKDLQGGGNNKDPTLVLWVTSSLRQLMTLEDEYAAVMSRKNNSAAPVAPGVVSDSNAMMLHQQEMMRRQQDEGLDDIEAGVGRLKQTSLLIRDELEGQKGMLDSLHHEVDTTRENLRAASKRLDKIMTEMSDKGKVCCVVVLMFVLGILISVLVLT